MRHDSRLHLLPLALSLLIVGLAVPASADPSAGWKDRDRQAHRRDAGRRDDDRERGRGRRSVGGDDSRDRHDGASGKHGRRDDHRGGRNGHDDHRYDDHRYDRHRYDRHRYDQYRRNDWRYNRSFFGSSGFYAPRHLHPGLLRDLEPYRWGRQYHRGHHHYHSIFSFPVWIDDAWAYRPYAYCGDDFFGIGVFTDYGPHFSVTLGF